MKSVRLVAKPNTWYKVGTEVFHEDLWDKRELLTLEAWESCIKDRGIGCVGLRVCEDNPNEIGNGWKPGFERIDGEWCSTDEFEVEIIDIPSK